MAAESIRVGKEVSAGKLPSSEGSVGAGMSTKKDPKCQLLTVS